MAERLGYYVYLLIDPRTETPFYVGKGVGDRCFADLAEAQKTGRDSRGDYVKLATIREIEGAGLSVRIDVLRHDLDEPTAFAVESAAIDLLGMPALTNRVVGRGTTTLGRMGVDDVNALYGARPAEFESADRVMLVRVAREFRTGISEDDLYEATRQWWRVQERRRRPNAKWAPVWAMAVYRGVVRAVYRIDGWEPAGPEHIAGDPIRAGRWGFNGKRDPAMEDRFLLTDVTQWLPQAAQNPIRYVNCG